MSVSKCVFDTQISYTIIASYWMGGGGVARGEKVLMPNKLEFVIIWVDSSYHGILTPIY